jgi:hypothetical protein
MEEAEENICFNYLSNLQTRPLLPSAYGDEHKGVFILQSSFRRTNLTYCIPNILDTQVSMNRDLRVVQ